MKTLVLFALVLAALSASGKVIFKKTGETVVLDCGLEDSGTLKWTRESDAIFSVRLGGFPTKGNSAIQKRCVLRQPNLEVQRVIEADAGTFKCKVGGREQEITLVVFSVSVSPSPELQLASQAELRCSAQPVPVAVQWLRPDGSVGSKSPTVHLNPVAQQDAGTWQCAFTFGDDRHAEPVEVTVTEPRPTTLSPPSRISGNGNVSPGKAGDHTSPPKMELLGIALWIWALIGVGSLVVALLLAIVILCLCRRARRRRRLARKMKNGHQLRTAVQYCQCDGPTAAVKPQQRRQRAKPSAPPLVE